MSGRPRADEEVKGDALEDGVSSRHNPDLSSCSGRSLPSVRLTPLHNVPSSMALSCRTFSVSGVEAGALDVPPCTSSSSGKKRGRKRFSYTRNKGGSPFASLVARPRPRTLTHVPRQLRIRSSQEARRTDRRRKGGGPTAGSVANLSRSEGHIHPEGRRPRAGLRCVVLFTTARVGNRPPRRPAAGEHIMRDCCPATC